MERPQITLSDIFHALALIANIDIQAYRIIHQREKELKEHMWLLEKGTKNKENYFLNLQLSGTIAHLAEENDLAFPLGKYAREIFLNSVKKMVDEEGNYNEYCLQSILNLTKNGYIPPLFKEAVISAIRDHFIVKADQSRTATTHGIACCETLIAQAQNLTEEQAGLCLEIALRTFYRDLKAAHRNDFEGIYELYKTKFAPLLEQVLTI